MNSRLIKRFFIPFVLSAVLILTTGFRGSGNGSSTYTPRSTPGLGKKAGDAFRFFINNINMPMNSSGVMGDVSIGGSSEGRIDGINFLFSGGFFLSGKNPNGSLWANAVASASRIQDFQPGRARAAASDDAQIYVIDGANPPFGQDWQDWSGAVALGADYYDGNRNGLYDPVDLNGNKIWDPNEDRPDLLGDQTAWCIYTDKTPQSQRRWTDQAARGIDIQQTVFGFRSAGPLGNMVFLRYRIINSGTVASRYDSVYFGVWADSDLGDFEDDLVGSDIGRNAGFTYNDGDDNSFGSTPPCFLIDFFQGPIVYIPGVTFLDNNNNGRYDAGDTPLTTARNIRGQHFNLDTVSHPQTYPGAKNLGLSSFVNYIQSNPDRGDPAFAIEARNYMLGRLRLGGVLNPANDPFGTVRGPAVPESLWNFWYHGDPVANTGWLYTNPSDVRQMQNTGPFTLIEGQPVDIVVAYIVGRGTDARNSVALAKQFSDKAQFIYDRNFEAAPPPPPVTARVRTTENSIEVIWDTYEQMRFRHVTSAWDMRFQGFEVTMYNKPGSTAATEGGKENAKVIARYDKADIVDNILIESADGQRNLRFQKGIQIDSATYANSSTGRIRLVITTDPFTGKALLKGRPYFIAITGYAVDHLSLLPVRSGSRDYYVSAASFSQFTANQPTVINGAAGIVTGSDLNAPFRFEEQATQSSGVAAGKVYVNEVFREQVSGNKYQLSFFRDATQTKYSLFWRVKDLGTNTVKLDSQRVYPDSLDYAVRLVDGLRFRPVQVQPAILTPTYTNATKWYTLRPSVYYPGKDLPGDPNGPEFLRSRQSNLTIVEKMRQIEIRFGPTQKAYRYVNTFSTLGSQNPTQGVYEYAGGMELRRADTTGGRPIPPNFKRGYVDVPFQVWIKDARRGEERQMNCGFMENRVPRVPDGIWDPTANLDSSDATGSREWIIVFDTPYSPDTSLVYTGGNFNGVRRFANVLTGWTKPDAWTNITLSAEDSARAADPLLGALYVVPLQRRIVGPDTLRWANGEVLTIPITYPFTSADTYTYQSSVGGGKLDASAKKAAFDRVNVFPNPLFGYNPGGSFTGTNPDDPYVTFSNLPEEVTIRIYSLSGVLLRTLSKNNASPFMQWNLQNEAGLRVASGVYLAIVTAPGVGERVLKLAVMMPQKQIQRF
jgi:hypothetical protein